MAQYQIFVGADTKSATNQLQRLDKVVTGVTKARELAIKIPNVKTFERQIRSATNNAVKGLKSVVKNADNVKGAFDTISKAANPSTFLAGSFKGANAGAQSLLDRLARLTVVLYGVNAAVGVLQRSFMGFYNATIGEANRFEESLLRTKTTLASTSDVFIDGKKITDPLKAIEGLTGVIDERIESIRLRTIDIAGVTSGEVVEVFSIVASQAGQIGASLEDAENLAISFAAALGTFGLPLRQARQEITSILQGNVNVDSYLAQALQITNEDISKARSQIGGITKFLQDKLATAVAGQSIAAKTLGGVLSNIRDIWEEFTKAIGTPLLAPLVAGVDAFYTTLGNSLKTIKAIGTEFGQVFATIARGAAAAAGFGGLDQSRITEAQKATAALLNNLQAQFARLNNALEGLFTRIEGQLGTIFDNLGGQVAMIGEAFAKLGEAVLVLTNAQIESFVGAIAQLIPILTGAVAGVTSLIKVWAELLKLPIVQAFVRIQTTFKVLEKTGIMGLATMITKFVLFRKAILASIAAMWKLATTVKRAIGIVVLAFGKVLVAITMLIAKLTALGLKFGIISKKMAGELTKLSAQMLVLGNNAKATGASMQTLGTGVNFVTRAFAGLIKTTIVLAAVQLAIVGIVEAISLWQRKQAEIARDREVANSIKYLEQTADAAARGGLTNLQKKLREIAQEKVSSKIDEVATEIAELNDEIAELEEKAKNPFNYTGEFGVDDPRLKLQVAQSKRNRLEKEYAALQLKLGIMTEKNNVEVRARESKKLEKELAELRKSLADDEFRYRQRLASAEVDRFRTQTQLELQRMQKSLQARLKGEEGISRLFMERLNDYLLTKKRGEDEIAERQQRLNITLANLQKEIADYKYNTEKKIAALQEKMGKFQMEVADYRLKQARNAEQAGGAGGALVDLISRSESFGGNYGAFNRGGSDGGHTAHGSGIDDNLVTRTIKDIMAEQARGEIHAVGKYQIIGKTMRGLMSGAYGATGVTPEMKFTPENQDKLFKALARNRIVSNNPEATMAGLRQEWIGLQNIPDAELLPAVKQLLASANALDPAKAKTEKPKTPDWDLSDVDTSGVTSSLQQLQKVLADINALKDELTKEQIAEKFVNITEGLFGDIALEPLQDQLQKASDLFDATAESADRLTDATKREIEYQVEVNRKTKERDAILKAIADDTELSAEKKAELEAKVTEEYNNHITKLGQAEDLKRKILATTQAQLALERMVAETKALEEQTQDNMLRMRLEMEGLSDIEIQGELKKAQYAREFAKAMKEAEEAGDPKKVAELRKQWEKLAAAIDQSTKVQLEARNPLRQLYTQWKKDLNDVNAYYAQMAQVVQTQIAQALSSAIIGAIEGTTTVKEAFANMFKAIGKAFIDMATQMIAKALVMRVLGIFLPGAGASPMGGGIAQGAGVGSFGGDFTGAFMQGVASAGAQGLYVNSPTPALIGEGSSPEYVIPENKMAASMARWAQGMRGKGVVEGADSSFASQNRSGAQPTALGDVSKRFNPGNNYSAVNNYNGSDSAADQYSINITGEQLVFNEKNYVSQDELPGIISQASKQGEARTLRKLRMSQGTRQRLGF